ncbi:hypothetical protein MMC21_006902 [Puttea exsequens]|nr:hypothetical protein [Puttea exsequens]
MKTIQFKSQIFHVTSSYRMFCPQQILFHHLITHLLPCTSASAIPQESEVPSATDLGLLDPSTSDTPQLGRRDEDFTDWFTTQAHDPSPVVSYKLIWSLGIIDLEAKLGFDRPQVANDSALSSRDFEANSAPDTAPDVEQSPNSLGFSPGAGGRGLLTSKSEWTVDPPMPVEKRSDGGLEYGRLYLSRLGQ